MGQLQHPIHASSQAHIKHDKGYSMALMLLLDW
jgi:hypothetical protein